MNYRNQQQPDPLKKQSEVSLADMGQGLSPMSPPEAYSPPAENPVDYNSLHPFLKNLMIEHTEFKDKILILKEVLQSSTEKNALDSLEIFLGHFNQEVIPHNRREESKLFVLLNERLLQNGEHSQTKEKITGIKILKDDHNHAFELGSNISSLLETMPLLKDQPSRKILLCEILKITNELTQLLELHIFREDQIVFGLAQKLLTKPELDEIHSDFI